VFITNHALAGAALGRVVRRPGLAFAAGLASHVGMDMVRHYGPEDMGWDELVEIARVDGLVGLGVCAAALAASPRHARAPVAAAIVGACLIDLDKPGRHFVGRSPFPPALDRFHGRIQNEGDGGGLVEALVALAFAAALASRPSLA
jgi:hypothetical protein